MGEEVVEGVGGFKKAVRIAVVCVFFVVEGREVSWFGGVRGKKEKKKTWHLLQIQQEKHVRNGLPTKSEYFHVLQDPKQPFPQKFFQRWG